MTAEGRRRGWAVDTDGCAGTVRVVEQLPLVNAIARVLSRRLPSTVELNELISDGVLGLLDAARRYDGSRGVSFSTYAAYRIRGAILDGLRTRDPLPRRVRRARKRAIALAGGPYQAGGVQLLELDTALGVPEDDSLGPEARAIEADLLRCAWRGLAALPPRDRRVLILRLVHGLTLREVAARLALSITRIAEIQARGLKRLRRFVDGEPVRGRSSLARRSGRTIRWQSRTIGAPPRAEPSLRRPVLEPRDGFTRPVPLSGLQDAPARLETIPSARPP